jgi:hypothetical protein
VNIVCVCVGWFLADHPDGRADSIEREPFLFFV